MDNIIVRVAGVTDELFLWEALYHALYVPAGAPAFDRAVVHLPEIARYVEGWGRDGDLGVIAIDRATGLPVGAAWLRLWPGDDKGYGYIDDETPELSISVVPDWRGRGVGTRLIEALLVRARGRYRAISLSVTVGNPAMRLYERMGFVTAATSGESATMRLEC